MKRMAVLATLLATLAACGGGGRRGGPIVAPEARPGDFAVTLTTRGYPIPAPDIRIQLWPNGTGNYMISMKEPEPGTADGPFEVTPDQLDEIYRVMRDVDFFGLDEDYIADPPLRGRGVDLIVVSAAGGQHVVRSEYAQVKALDAVRAAILKVLPAEAFAGASRQGEGPRYVVDKSNGLIYTPDCPEFDEIPEENRIYFSNPYAALDAGYHPSPSCQPFPR